jgi:transcriptional regulator with XRE-family HTH domain
MPREKSIFTREYSIFLSTLRRVREEAGRTQADVGKVMGRDQSVVSKCERGERRLDIIETRVYCKGIGMEFDRFIKILEAEIEGQKGKAPSRIRKR